MHQSFQFINKHVLALEFYEVGNTVTCEFAFCDCTLIVAMVTLQEPYFPKHVFSLIHSGNLVLSREYAHICARDRTHSENFL